MKTFVAKALLIITLVGQFILTPAMGMPNALLSMLHSGQSEMSMEMTAMDSVSTSSDMENMMFHMNSSCSMAGSHSGLLSQLDCQSLCDIVGGGHCAAYNGSIPAIVELPSFEALKLLASETIPLSAWSVKTAEPTSLYQPPIS